jgi:hypothetical protein
MQLACIIYLTHTCADNQSSMQRALYVHANARGISNAEISRMAGGICRHSSRWGPGAGAQN